MEGIQEKMEERGVGVGRKMSWLKGEREDTN